MSLCTMFAFAGVDDPNILHCTHKFFGDEYTGGRDKVVKALEAYFSQNPFKPFTPRFSRLEENFGKDGTYRVVRPESNEEFLMDLKSQLDGIHADNWPEYKPHVTVGRNTDSLEQQVRDYVLMEDHKPVWSARQFLSRKRLAAKEMEDDFKDKGKSMSDFDSDLDKSLPDPGKKTPAEMKQNPNDFMDPADDQTDSTDDSGKQSGRHDWSINDNDSTNGPA